MSSLFDSANQENISKDQPLAARMRPQSLDDFMGQNHLVGQGMLLRTAIENDQLTSFIFWGPAGCGKSTLAGIIANTTKSSFENFSAVTSGIPEIKKVIERARERKKINAQKTILFIDEIHRFNKAQQDALLPHVEDGTVILIGATTENPYFEVNSPLLSRSKIMKFEPLTNADIEKIIKNAIQDKEKGYGNLKINISDDAINHIIEVADGDARNALSAIELSVKAAQKDSDSGKIDVNIVIVEQAVGRRILKYDKNGDNHYDVISAFIKSMRGSDPDAAVYWLARMLNSGEDPKFIARRIVIQAAEDVGNADPMALVVANAAAQAVQFVGMPEAQIPLAQAVIYLACAPKSNASYLAINRANKDVMERKIPEVPIHLRGTGYPGAKQLGHGKGYKYPHDYPGHFIEQEYLPENIKTTVYYEPTNNGHESKFRERLNRLRNAKQKEQDEKNND